MPEVSRAVTRIATECSDGVAVLRLSRKRVPHGSRVLF
jgi:hypothetical protein